MTGENKCASFPCFYSPKGGAFMLFDCFCDFCRYCSGNRMFFRSHVLEAGRRTNLSTKKGYSTSWCYIKSVILFVSKKWWHKHMRCYFFETAHYAHVIQLTIMEFQHAMYPAERAALWRQTHQVANLRTHHPCKNQYLSSFRTLHVRGTLSKTNMLRNQ